MTVTNFDAADLIRIICEGVLRDEQNAILLRDTRFNIKWRYDRALKEGHNYGEEVTQAVETLIAQRNKKETYAAAREMLAQAEAWLNVFFAERRADVVIKRMAERGITVTREQVYATEAAQLVQHYSVSKAVAELLAANA